MYIYMLLARGNNIFQCAIFALLCITGTGYNYNTVSETTECRFNLDLMQCAFFSKGN